MRMRAEALAPIDAVVVDDTQRAKPHVVRVVVVAERERMPTVEPIDLAVKAFVRATNDES